MIKMIRLDERLIHGQIAIKWSRLLNVDRIVVGNDPAAANEIIKKSLMMAAPSTCKVTIRSIDDTITLLHNPKAVEHDILVIVATPQDLLRVVTEVPGIQQINIGNYGRVAGANADHPKKMYTTNLYCDDDDVAVFKQIIATGIPASFQVIPDDSPEPLTKIFK
jgi:PTS system mannose-specific IIB component